MGTKNTTPLNIFEELVASEAAIRARSINKRHWFPDPARMGPVETRKISTENLDAVSADAATVELTPQQAIAKRFCDTFLKMYDYQFQDSSQHGKQDDAGRVYHTRDLTAEQRLAVERIFNQFVQNAYDNAGNLNLKPHEVVRELASLYEEFKQEDVKLARAVTTLGVFMVELSQSDKWKALIPQGIDFTRGEPGGDIMQRLENAINGQNHQPHTDRFIEPPGAESVVEIAGLHFPFKKIDGKMHIVSDNGYLVDLTNPLREDIARQVQSGVAPEEIRIDVPEGAQHLVQFMDRDYLAKPREKKREEGGKARVELAQHLSQMAGADEIDGVACQAGSGGQHGVFCLDADLMTGLLMKPRAGEQQSELAIFKGALKKAGVSNLIDLIPADASQHYHALEPAQQLQERARIESTIRGHLEEVASMQNEQTADIIRRAQEKVASRLCRAYISADKAFLNEYGEYKTPPKASPHVYVAQGGTGSGKGGLKKIAQKECEKHGGAGNVVLASLDDMRGDSDRLWLYPALNIHHDDYIAIGDFGNAVRDLTVKRAQQGKYNLFIDGSGIPYEERNDLVVEDFKKKGYHVSVLGAQAPLSINQPMPEDALYNVVTMRSGARLQDELRIVPMKVVIAKHQGHPIAANNAARDRNVDNFMIMDTAPPVGQSYTLSYVAKIPAETFKKIATLEDGALRTALMQNGLVPENVTWPNELPAEKDIPQGVTKADMKVVGVENGHYRVHVIINMPQYVNMVQKGLYNVDAKGPKDFFTNTLKSDIEGYFKGEGGRLRLQPALGISAMPWPDYHPPLADHVQWQKNVRPALPAGSAAFLG